MYCTKCGAQLPDNAKFCMSCGKPVAPIATEPSKANDEDHAQEAPAITNDTSEAEKAHSAKSEAEPHDESTAEKTNNASSQSKADEKAPATENDEQNAQASDTPANNDEPESQTDEPENSSEPETETDDSADGAEPEAAAPSTDEADSKANPETATAPASADKTTVLVKPATPDPNATTVLPGVGAEKAALEQEYSDQVEALSTLYPDIDPGQFCDPTPVEAQSPDITEYIAPAPMAEGEAPASAEALHYAVDSTKKRSRRRVPMIVLVALAMALAAGTAYAAYRIYNDVWLPSQQEQTSEPAEEAPAEPETPQNISYSVENDSMDVSVPADPIYEPGVRGTTQWYYPRIKASAHSDAVDKINDAIKQSMQADVDATNAAPDTQDALNTMGSLTCTERSITVTYIDSDIVCVRDERYDTGWGPHGTTTVTGCVYDLKTGETIDPGSVFGLTASQLKTAASSAVSTFLQTNPSDLYSSNEVEQDVQSTCTDDPATATSLNTLDGSSYFYISNEGLIYATADYQLGSFAFGRREIVVVARDGSGASIGSTVAITSPFGANGTEQ